jgi:hypothetical protein
MLKASSFDNMDMFEAVVNSIMTLSTTYSSSDSKCFLHLRASCELVVSTLLPNTSQRFASAHDAVICTCNHPDMIRFTKGPHQQSCQKLPIHSVAAKQRWIKQVPYEYCKQLGPGKVLGSVRNHKTLCSNNIEPTSKRKWDLEKKSR